MRRLKDETDGAGNTDHLSNSSNYEREHGGNKWNHTSREVHEMFKTTAIDTLKQDKKCQACWYFILSTMSGSTTDARLYLSSLHHCLFLGATPSSGLGTE